MNTLEEPAEQNNTLVEWSKQMNTL
jgi:hypothetical protein